MGETQPVCQCSPAKKIRNVLMVAQLGLVDLLQGGKSKSWGTVDCLWVVREGEK